MGMTIDKSRHNQSIVIFINILKPGVNRSYVIIIAYGRNPTVQDNQQPVGIIIVTILLTVKERVGFKCQHLPSHTLEDAVRCIHCL